MNLTRRESLIGHEKMWRCLGEHPDWNKEDYFQAHPRLKRPDNLCYACDYENGHKERYCGETCIITWPGGACIDSSSPFAQWNH